MPRYFIEVSYKGTAYSGFQVQKNSNTIQSEVEKALEIFFKQHLSLTGASRTDTGVHALQNFFHFDAGQTLVNKNNIDKSEASKELSPGQSVKIIQEDLVEAVYHINAILPRDIVIKRIFEVPENKNCRFDAISREYKYF
ncbi:MAG: tRNA pseudouridine synthase A, partial [Ginsengibacter sp.]